MSARLLHPDEFELAARSSVDSQETFNLDEADFESQSYSKSYSFRRKPAFLSRLLSFTFSGYRRIRDSGAPLPSPRRPVTCYRRLLARRSCFLLHAFTGIILALMILTSIFRPSYTRLPAHYEALRKSVSESNAPGRGNPRNEKVFIAASIYDKGGDLARGQWGKGILDLIDLLGEDNVFLSIYENDSGEEGQAALQELQEKVRSKKSIVFEEHLNLSEIPHVTLPDGSQRIKRIAYLAEVRNRALRPLDQHPEIEYDRLLYLNDVVFDPVDVLQLLFSTNAAQDGVAQYRAACSVDFINPFKFYDTYATRDLQGYSMGVPFFPWFTSAGSGQSRRDVLAGKDTVRVRSCWGGIVAFDAKYFQGHNPVRFRAEKDLFWDASECCLIHADIQDPAPDIEAIPDTGIYMNPYVRVAYDSGTLSWLRTTRRFERLYSLIHWIVNHIAGLPRFNPRRGERPGTEVDEKVWVADDKLEGGGSFVTVKRLADPGGFCGRRGLQVVVEDRKKGQGPWETLPVPSV
ncbi:CAZyme family GT69 [Paecilomyces variotii]|nr:CAZyme family GT69 [Paecilomyces variotii]